MHREPAISVFMPVHDAAAYLAFVHATIMFRRALFLEIGGYRSECTVWDDMDLCRRLAARGRVMVLPAALYRYRFHPDSTTLRRSGTDLSVVTERMYEQLAPSRRDGRSGRSGPRAETFYYVLSGSGPVWRPRSPGGCERPALASADGGRTQAPPARHVGTLEPGVAPRGAPRLHRAP